LFADEERLREKITKVYVSVCYQDAPPTNLQIQNITLLQSDLTKSQQKNDNLMNDYKQKWSNVVRGGWYNDNIGTPH